MGDSIEIFFDVLGIGVSFVIRALAGVLVLLPLHPELAEPLEQILGDTHQLIVYQEQVMAIAQKLAGYSLGKADLLRRAMGKKKKEIIDAEFVPFRDGMRANGYSEEAISTLWGILVPFSDYAFNKAHTAGYGLVAYWTGYLKANYPAEYMESVEALFVAATEGFAVVEVPVQMQVQDPQRFPPLAMAVVVVSVCSATMVCSALMISAATTTGSRVRLGIDACPPRPAMRMTKLSSNVIIGPLRTANEPAGNPGMLCMP